MSYFGCERIGDFSKTNNSDDNYSVIDSTWDNATNSGVAVNSNTRSTYSESSSNNQSSYDDGKSKNKSNTDTYTQNQSQEINSSNGTDYWRNNRNNNYSVSQGNDTQTYKHGPQTSSRITDSYSVNKSDGYSANSSGKVTSKNNQESYSENRIQNESEYKIDAYTTTSRGDDQTITSTRSNTHNDGTNNNSSSSSDTVRTQNSQTVTVYKDGLKNESEGSSYQRWWSDTSTDRGVSTTASGSETWSSSYSRSEFKGGYSWSESRSGTNAESVTKGGTTTSKQTNWSWSRNVTVWDDGRNSWSESWSKSNWDNGRSIPGESDSLRGEYDPKKTGQVDNAPKVGEAPRLPRLLLRKIDWNNPPLHQPQPSKGFYDLPIAEPNIADKFAGNPFGAPPPQPGWPPQDIGSYWLSYTGTFANKSPSERRQIFRDIINNPSIKKVYMNVLSAFGVTFAPSTTPDINMIKGLQGQDVFKEFKEELDKYNSSKPLNQQRKIDVVGWFEATGMSLPGSILYEVADRSRYQNAGGKTIPDTSAVLKTKTDQVPTLDILHPNVHSKLKEIVNDFLRAHPFVNEIIFDDRYGILEPAEPEIIRRYADKIPLSYKTGEDNKRWIMEQVTKNLEDIKKSIPKGKKLGISGQNFYSAEKTNNQDLRTWLKKGLIDGELNFQLYVPGNEYDRFVQEYNRYINNFNEVFSQPGAPARPSISVSVSHKAKNIPLTRKEIIKQARFLRNIIPGDPSPEQRPRLPLSPAQILGFDYGLFNKINQ